MSLLVAATVALVPAAGAQAQDANQNAKRSKSEGDLLQEVTVTAQRRREKAQDVPIAITALSAQQLTRLNINDTLDLIRVVPNLMGSNNTGLGTANVYSLRGLNNTESIATFDPPVGTYVDDVFIARQNANNFTLFDVDRIEVLRGPQGTLFGRNTTGGAISIHLKPPAEQFGGFFEAGLGSYGKRQLRFSVDLPISDKLLTKLSAYHIGDDGYVSDPTTGQNNLNSRDSYGVRGAIRWLPTDDLIWDLSVDYMHDNWMNLLNFDRANPQSVGLPGPVSCAAGTPATERFTCTGLRTDASNLTGLLTGRKQYFPLGNLVKSVSVTSNIAWTTDIGTVNFITGYRDMNQQFALDFYNGAAPYGGFTIANDGKHRQFTQEIKLDGKVGNVDYVTGLYYFNENNHTDFGDIFGLLGFPLILEDRIMKNTAKSWAVYGQADWHFADKWVATLGARFTDEKKTIAYIANPNPLITKPMNQRVTSANMAAAGIPLSKSTQLVTPRFALQYNLSQDVNFFASATRGFKSGGWNARCYNPSLCQPFSAEKEWSYELGMKSEWLDHTLRFNLTGFYYDVKDFQLPSAFNSSTGIVFITQNFASLQNQGVEAELVWAPVESLNLYANVGIQNPKYKDLNPSIKAQLESCQSGVTADCGLGIVTPEGTIAEPVRAPDTYTVGATYYWHLTPSISLVPNIYATRLSDHNVGTAGTAAGLVKAYTVVNASLALQGDNWSVTAQCNNCDNKTYVVSILPPYQYLGDPRTWGVTYRYNF